MGLNVSRLFIALHSGSCLFCAILLIILIENNSNHTGSKKIKYYSILSIIMYGLSSFVIVLFYIINSHTLWISAILEIIFSMSWRLGQSFMYLLFLERLKQCFKNTKYSSSKMTFTIFYIGIFCFVLTEIIKYIIYCYFHFLTPIKDFDPEYFIVQDVDFGIILLTDASLSIGIIILFIKKLSKLNIELTSKNQLIKYQYQCSINSNSNLISTYDINTNNKQFPLSSSQQSIVGIMAKITLLSSICLISSQITIFLGLLLFLCEAIPGYKHFSYIFWNLQLIYLSINPIIISTCITLGFDFSYLWYRKVCNKTNKLCIMCCSTRTKKKITKISNTLDSYSYIDINNNYNDRYSVLGYNNNEHSKSYVDTTST